MTQPLQRSNHAPAPQGNKRHLYKINSVTLPILLTLLLLLGGGIFLLEKAERQARDTTRKHHIEDIEESLYFSYSLKGTFPPYEEATWCGTLSDPKNSEVLAQIEQGLRTQNEKYANPAKPFPSDPKFKGDSKDYFYWKRSPASFELYAQLEEDPNNERNTTLCSNATAENYDYSVASVWRQDSSGGNFTSSPL